MQRFTFTVIAGLCLLASSVAAAQTRAVASTAGTKVSSSAGTVGGTAGSAAAAGTSASTLGLGARSGSSAVVVGGGSAAAVQGRAISNTRIRENPQMLRAQSRATAMDGGTWSRSMSQTTLGHDNGLRSWTRSMAHQPGSRPVMSTTRIR